MNISYKTVSKLVLSLGVLASSFLFTSCDKDDTSSSAVQSDAIPTATLNKIAKSLPKVKFVNESNQRTFVTNEGVTFIDGGEGFTFANAQGPTFSTNSGVTFAESGSVVYIDGSALPSGAAATGGTVIAGNTSLDIDLALCFGADEEALSIGTDFGFEGVSAVIGISGDFESINENSTEEDFANIFNGIAGYYVFEDNADGTYKVLDLDSIEDEEEPTGVSFAFVIDVKNGYYYISNSGNLTVNGGSISFNGNYYALKFDFYDTESEMGDNWKEVSGFGAMGCDM